MLVLNDIVFAFPGHDPLFRGIDLSISASDKAALIGDNGTGKSTLMRILAGTLQPRSGRIACAVSRYHVPQGIERMDGTVAQALGIAAKLDALHRILGGNMLADDLTTLNDDWSLEERCRTALANWRLAYVDPHLPMDRLSGGERTKVMLAGIDLHRPELLLLDEPSNHLDRAGRELLQERIGRHAGALVLVSHDRELLERCTTTYVLETNGIKVHGGNYSFYQAQRAVEQEAIAHSIHAHEHALRKARQQARDTAERKQRMDARGQRKQEKAGLPTIAMNTLRDQAQRSGARLKNVHTEKMERMHQELAALRDQVNDLEPLKLAFGRSTRHAGRMLFEGDDLNVQYSERLLWPVGLSFRISSGERIALKGSNGSGKTTLIKLLLNEREPDQGLLHRAAVNTMYIDQHYSIMKQTCTVYEQAQRYNSSNMPEHEVKIRLDRFLFPRTEWDKPCVVLSGGERMRLLLCCVTIRDQAPDLLVMDEPTNNLDLRSMRILTAAVRAYRGTLLVVSHDALFLEEVGVHRTLDLGSDGS